MTAKAHDPHTSCMAVVGRTSISKLLACDHSGKLRQVATALTFVADKECSSERACLSACWEAPHAESARLHSSRMLVL
jgi:hypothetical protein